MRGLLKRSGKRTVCGMVSSRNQKPPSWEKARVATALYHAEAFVCLLKSAPSRIMRVSAADYGSTKKQVNRQRATMTWQRALSLDEFLNNTPHARSDRHADPVRTFL